MVYHARCVWERGGGDSSIETLSSFFYVVFLYTLLDLGTTVFAYSLFSILESW